MKIRHYENASGGVWDGYYRIFLVKNLKFNTEFLIGFAIFSTIKTVNDPKYGNSQGTSVLAICYCDEKIDQMSVEINLNKFLKVDEKNKKAIFMHNGASGKKGFRKAEFIKYVQNKNENLVSNLIEYAVYRSEYKNSL